MLTSQNTMSKSAWTLYILLNQYKILSIFSVLYSICRNIMFLINQIKVPAFSNQVISSIWIYFLFLKTYLILQIPKKETLFTTLYLSGFHLIENIALRKIADQAQKKKSLNLLHPSTFDLVFFLKIFILNKRQHKWSFYILIK